MSEVLIFENGFVKFYNDEVIFVDGTRGRHLRVAAADGSGPGVVLLPVYGRSVCLVKTYRYALQEAQWALPRGFGHDTDPMVTAREELREETGVVRGSFDLMGWVTPDSGMLSSKVAVVYVSVEERKSAPEDVVEVRDLEWIEIPALWERVSEGTVEDGFTLSALSLAHAQGRI